MVTQMRRGDSGGESKPSVLPFVLQREPHSCSVRYRRCGEPCPPSHHTPWDVLGEEDIW